jgi:hypothetical protein
VNGTDELEVGIPPEIRPSAIPEPGGKIRIITVGDCYLSLFLQPFSHSVKDLIMIDPLLESGLRRAE